MRGIKMFINEKARNVGDSPTLVLDGKAKQLVAAKEPVIHLGGGEPQSPVPLSAVRAGIEKLNSGRVKYTAGGGTEGLKKAVIKHTLENYGQEIKSENILVSNGAKQAIYTFLYSVLDEGDEVIYPAPYWVSYPELVKMCKGIPKAIQPKKGTFEPDFEDIKSAVTAKTKVIMLNSPSNPCGAVYSDALVEKVVKFCEEKGIYLLMDDIYRQLVFDGVKPASAFKYAKNRDNLVIINGVSKLFGMTGFRIGWAIANKDLIKVMTKIQVQVSSCPSDLSQFCAQSALENPQNYVEELVRDLKENRDALINELSALSRIKIIKPQGTFYCFADFSAYDADSNRLAAFLLEKVLVVTIPGAGFGMDGYLRLSYCGNKKDIIEGVRRIRWALDETMPREILIGSKKIERNWK